MAAGVQHVSIRVPWHDTGWEGTICAAPSENASCVVLERIRKERRDAVEDAHRGTDWSEPRSVLPPCVRERVGFMRAREFTTQITHPYADRGSPVHANLKPLTLRFPAYSAPCVPFRWLLRDEAEVIAETEGVDYRPELEDEADALIPFPSSWVQHGDNQRALLDGFFKTVQPPALTFFYAKRVPLTEEDRRILIGVGRVQHVAKPQVYGGDNPLGTLAWECMVQHSVRPGHEDGFLLPYHEALAAAQREPDLDLEQFVAFAPDDDWLEFRFASEHVSHDTAISALLACARDSARAPSQFVRARAAVAQRSTRRAVDAAWAVPGPRCRPAGVWR